MRRHTCGGAWARASSAPRPVCPTHSLMHSCTHSHSQCAEAASLHRNTRQHTGCCRQCYGGACLAMAWQCKALPFASDAVAYYDKGEDMEAIDDEIDSDEQGASQPSSRIAMLRMQLLGPTKQQLDQFQALWAEYGRELQLSRETMAMVVTKVTQGALPCDARLLRARAMALIQLEQEMPEVKPRYLLAHSNAALSVNVRLLAAAARRLRKLLRHRDLPSLLVTLLPVLGRADMDVLVCELLELEAVLCPIWNGAAVPNRVANLWLMQQALDYTKMRSKHRKQQARLAASSKVQANSTQTAAASTQEQEVLAAGRGSARSMAASDGVDLADVCKDLMANVAATRLLAAELGISLSSNAADRALQAQLQQQPPLSTRSAVQVTSKPMKHQPLQQASHAPAQAHVTQQAKAAAADLSQQGGSRKLRLELHMLLARCKHLHNLLGAEPSYSAVSKSPRVLLGLTPDQATSNFTALQAVLRLTSTAAALLVESDPRVLCLTPDALQAQLSGLSLALGWKQGTVLQLVQGCAKALMASPTAVAAQWRKLQSVAPARQEWAQVVDTSSAYALSTLLTRPDPWQSLARLEYLSRHPGEMRGVPWERVVKMTQPAFVQQCPGFFTSSWKQEPLANGSSSTATMSKPTRRQTGAANPSQIVRVTNSGVGSFSSSKTAPNKDVSKAGGVGGHQGVSRQPGRSKGGPSKQLQPHATEVQVKARGRAGRVTRSTNTQLGTPTGL